MKETFKKLKNEVVKRAPVLTTTTALVSATTTVIFAAQAGAKAAKQIEEIATIEGVAPTDISLQDKTKLVWKTYIPTALSFTVCVTSIVGVHKVGQARFASMAAVYAVTERAYSEYRDRVVEEFGEEASQKIRDKLTSEKVKENEPASSIVISGDEVLCLDEYTGRYFRSTPEEIERCVNKLNMLIVHDGYASLSDFYDLVGLDSTSMSEDVGWTSDELMSVKYGAAMAKDNRPCLELYFQPSPTTKYNRTF